MSNVRISNTVLSCFYLHAHYNFFKRQKRVELTYNRHIDDIREMLGKYVNCKSILSIVYEIATVIAILIIYR